MAGTCYPRVCRKKRSTLDDNFVDIEWAEKVPQVGARYENLVLEGGGVKGIALAAAVVELHKNGVLAGIRRFAGSSAGGIIAGALAIGYTPREMLDVMRSTDFAKFLDDSLGIIKDMARLFKKYGYHKGEYFYEWLKELIAVKVGRWDYTFGQLWEERQIELVVTGTNITMRRLEYFSHRTHPEMPIALAVRISMSLPYIFVPVRYNLSYYVDGGLLNNYPLDVFGEGNDLTLGLKLVDPEEERIDEIKRTPVEISSLLDFTTSLFGLILLEIERSRVGPNYWPRTISINTGTIRTTDFNLDEPKMRFLYLQGKEAVQEFFRAPEE